MTVCLEFMLRFELASGFHTTGDRVELWTDKALALDWYGCKTPIIPATSIKGWLRENAERILRAMGERVCDGSQPTSTCKSAGNACLVCRIFGNPRRRSALFFYDGKLAGGLTDTRTSVSLSRHRRTAFEERLFTTEVAWGRSLEVTGRGFFATPEEAKQAAAIVWLSAKAGFALGAARSRGLGWMRLVSSKFKCDGTVIPEREIQALLNEWRGER